ncbi:hypothetical protein BDV38DRAFT_286433 [Aspergillus pseudotamarii]|uniref:Ricin B lectin domain-containing protein n=1 Tax=Aspergillus pseudotamarii TaxID=132259 RepID=A0A5N6SJF4_ASPPS|nr:uncharacterized protein BDV38DRAFT_286433 [Aspergillus pseudotamarii]KAE8133811.1 hypothetical protein BDV38DRAFT_286433 [Aspergillus pseudotamarii]
MKVSAMLSLLAMHSCQALAQYLEGTYAVASAGTELYLADASGTITFKEGDPQAWFFIEADIDQYAIVNNGTNQYINCGSEEGAICSTSATAQLFLINNISGDIYTFQDPGSELLLHRNSNNQLDLSPPTPTNDESFQLTQI